MKKIEGIFSGEVINNYSICIETYGQLGLKYASYRDEHIRLFLKEMPDFEMVFETFMSESIILFKSNRILDACLSLFYKPFYNEFYDRIKHCSNQISPAKKKYLIKYMLKYLADDMQYEIIVNRNMIDDNLRDYYIEKDIYVKSKELLGILK